MEETEDLWFLGPGRMVLRPGLRRPPAQGELEAVGVCSLISAGTEGLFYRGQVPPDGFADLSLNDLKAEGYPLRYGYCWVGRVTRCGPGVPPSRLNQLVQVFAPHGSHWTGPADQACPLPTGCPAQRGAFFAPLETALMLVLDTAPRVGERLGVLGAGTIGLLTAQLLARHPLADLRIWDPDSSRQERARAAGLTVAPLDPQSCDAVVEVSGSSEGAEAGLAALRFSGRLILGSWTGTEPTPLGLGVHAHRRRLRLVASQVSRFDPVLTGLWDKARLRDLTWSWLERLAPESGVTHTWPLAQAAQAYGALFDPGPRPKPGAVLLTGPAWPSRAEA